MDCDAHVDEGAGPARRGQHAPRQRASLPAVLFWLTQIAASILFALVFLAPLLNNGTERPGGWQRLLALFAADGVVRRTALASAIGLVVTANVFFRRPRAVAPESRSRTPGNVVGA